MKDVRDSHDSNAAFSRLVTVFGSVTEASFSHLPKAEIPIFVTPSGIVTFVKYVLEQSQIVCDLPDIVKPEDFKEINNLNVVYTGSLREYGG